MGHGRIRWGFTVLVTTALVAAPAAYAATPSTIVKDFEKDGRLDGRYSIQDLEAVLKSPTVQGYEKPTVETELRPAIKEKIAQQRGLRTSRDRGGLPFTGFDLALLTAGGALLLGVGAGMRRLARAKR